MTEAAHRHLVIWEARHDNGWTTLVMEQPDGTFVGQGPMIFATLAAQVVTQDENGSSMLRG